MKSKLVVIIALVISLVLTLTTGCSRNSRQQETVLEESYIPVEVETIKKDTISDKITFKGRIYANEEVMVMPQMPGTVSKVNVKLGDYVKKDQVLFVMEQKDIQRAIEQAQHGVELAKRSVEQAENAIKTAKIQYESTKERLEEALLNLERIKLLYEAGAVPKTQLEQAQMAASTKPLEAAQAQIKQTEIAYQQALNQLSQAESSYNHAKSNLDNTLVKSPISGLITSLNIVEGQLASNVQGAATIVDIDEVFLQVNVSENMVNRLVRGQEVLVNIPAALNEGVIGRIDYISPTVDPRTQLYLVKVYISNPNHLIKPGMSGELQLDTEIRHDVLVLRRSAIIDMEGEEIVYLVENDKAVKVQVATGLDAGLYVEVIEGLEEGDIVIIKGQHYVSDGQRVKVVRGE